MNINVEHSIAMNSLIIDKNILDYYDDYFGVSAFFSAIFLVVVIGLSFITNNQLNFNHYIFIIILAFPLSIIVTHKFVKRSERLYKIANNIDINVLNDVITKYLEDEDYEIRYRDDNVFILSEQTKIFNIPNELLFIHLDGNVYLNVRNKEGVGGRDPFVFKSDVTKYIVLFGEFLNNLNLTA